MPGLLAYAAAGALGAVGEGLDEQNKARVAAAADAALAKLRHDYRVDELQTASDLRMAEKGLAPAGRGGSRGLGAAAPSGSSGGSGSGGMGRADPAAPASAATSADAMFPTYDKPGTASTGGPDTSRTPAKLVGEREIDGYLFGRSGSEWFPYKGPDGGPVKSKSATGDGGSKKLTDLFTDDQGFRRGMDAEGKVQFLTDADGKKVRGAPAGAASSDAGPSEARTNLSAAIGSADPAVKAQANAEVDQLVASGKSEAEAVADVVSRLDRPDVVTNPAGTMASRALGLTPADAPPDATVKGPAKAVKPAGGSMVPPPPDVLAQAKAAIAKGADPAAVAARLGENGFTADGLF
jgi:hypothetical protein